MSSMTLTVPAEMVEHQAAQEQYRVLGDMLARSATDAEFRALMLNDAHAAFARFGMEVPRALDVVFIENQFDMTVVLPDALDELVELNDSDLMQINGGATPIESAIAATATHRPRHPLRISIRTLPLRPHATGTALNELRASLAANHAGQMNILVCGSRNAVASRAGCQ